MTTQEAEKLGYEIKGASSFEVGLIQNGKGVRTWWVSDFNGELPTLEHPLVQRAIETEEEMKQ